MSGARTFWSRTLLSTLWMQRNCRKAPKRHSWDQPAEPPPQNPEPLQPHLNRRKLHPHRSPPTQKPTKRTLRHLKVAPSILHCGITQREDPVKGKQGPFRNHSLQCEWGTFSRMIGSCTKRCTNASARRSINHIGNRTPPSPELTQNPTVWV